MDKIQATIDEEINSLLKLHKGSCEAVSLKDGVLGVRLHGGCVGCPSAKLTLFNVISPILKEKHQELVDIILV